MNVGKLLEEMYRSLGLMKLQSVATGGSTTTIVDTSLATKYGTNAFRKHLAFISRTTDGAAPQGQFGLLPASHYVASTQTFTIPEVTAAVGAGDIYTIVPQSQISLYEMIAELNIAMGMLPSVRLLDTSLTVADNTKEYTLPVATKGYPIQEIRVGNTTDGYNIRADYHIRPASAGSTETLEFKEQPGDTDDTIEITYLGKQTSLTTYSDSISEKYPDELVYSACAYRAIQYYLNKKGLHRNRRWSSIAADLEKRYNRAVYENPVREEPASIPRMALGRI